MSGSKLIADAMLGGLVRWLRVLDVDVAYDPSLDDAALVVRAQAEGRTILTRDRGLIQRRAARDHLLIESERVDDQLRQVLSWLGLDPDPVRWFQRCLRCNEPLLPVAAVEAYRWVPPFVARTQRRFRRCPACGRIYWGASHVRRMRERLRRMGIEV